MYKNKNKKWFYDVVKLLLFRVYSDFRYEMHKALRTPDILEIIFSQLDILSLASANDCCEVVGAEMRDSK